MCFSNADCVCVWRNQANYSNKKGESSSYCGTVVGVPKHKIQVAFDDGDVKVLTMDELKARAGTGICLLEDAQDVVGLPLRASDQTKGGVLCGQPEELAGYIFYRGLQLGHAVACEGSYFYGELLQSGEHTCRVAIDARPSASRFVVLYQATTGGMRIIPYKDAPPGTRTVLNSTEGAKVRIVH